MGVTERLTIQYHENQSSFLFWMTELLPFILSLLFSFLVAVTLTTEVALAESDEYGWVVFFLATLKNFSPYVFRRATFHLNC